MYIYISTSRHLPPATIPIWKKRSLREPVQRKQTEREVAFASSDWHQIGTKRFEGLDFLRLAAGFGNKTSELPGRSYGGIFLLATQIDSNQCAPGNTTRTAQTRLSVRYFCGRSKIRISISESSSRKGPHQASSTRSRQVGRLRVIRSQVNLTLDQIFSSSCSSSRALFRLRITAHQVSNTRALLRARARALLLAS